MLLAHLSGLLKPTYKHGVRSIAAESLILDAVELREVAAAQRLELQMHATFTQHMDSRNGHQLRQRVWDILRQNEQMTQYSLLNTALASIPKANGTVESVTELFYSLARAGMVTAPDSIE